MAEKLIKIERACPKGVSGAGQNTRGEGKMVGGGLNNPMGGGKGRQASIPNVARADDIDPVTVAALLVRSRLLLTYITSA